MNQVWKVRFFSSDTLIDTKLIISNAISYRWMNILK